MGIFFKIRLFVHKICHWEYWPTWIIYFPCFLIYPYYAIRSKSFLFFTVANPFIKYGGAFLASKTEINSKISSEYLPITYPINSDTALAECLQFMKLKRLNFPVILKPDMGLRGLGIKIISSEAALNSFLQENDQLYLLQEYLTYHNEIGIFVIRQIDKRLRITSIVKREFISIKGNGQSTVKELLFSNPRYAMQYDWLRNESYINENKVLSKGEELELFRIGNHSRGTIFRNANYILNNELERIINKMIGEVSGFNYGRLDIKYDNYEEFLQLGKFKIIELNGVFSEPAHIYDPNQKLIGAWKDLLVHFRYLFQISKRSLAEGYVPVGLVEGIKKIVLHFKMIETLKG